MAQTRTAKAAREISQRGKVARAARQEDLREKISGTRAIDAINKAVEELLKLDTEVKKAKLQKIKNTRTGATELVLPAITIDKANARVKILGKVIDTKLRLLAKVLPDLKQIELTDPDGNSFSTFAEAVARLNEERS